MVKVHFINKSFLLGFILLILPDILHSQNPIPAFPPDDVTRHMDYMQMLEQMNITLPLQSLKLGEYAPLDLLKMDNGTAITSPDAWWNQRRPEILQNAKSALYGAYPPDSILPKVTFQITTQSGGSGNSAYIQKNITGSIDISRYPEVRNKPEISAVLRIPANAMQSVPVMIVIAGFGDPLDQYWNILNAQGWGVCTFYSNTLQPDDGEFLTSYLIGLINKGNWRKPLDWGTIGAWSWGISRLIDYLETDQDVSNSAIGLTGHSRYGKPALVTMGFEPRIAIGFPSDAGSLGTKMNRRHWGQDLENSAEENEYHWMAGNFFQYVGELIPGQHLPQKIENCPVDAHSLLALCAPRPVFINGGTESSWSDPNGQYLTTKFASPVYELLGKKGVIMLDDKPQINKGYIEGDIAYKIHKGGNTDMPDWPDFFKFAAKYIHPDVLEPERLYINLPNEKSSGQLMVRSNKKWKIVGKSAWVESYSNSNKFIVSATQNNDKTARSTQFKIITSGIEKTIYINQSGKNPKTTISPAPLILDSNDGCTVELGINSNNAWSISSNAPWINPDKNSGINNDVVNFMGTGNPGVKKREALITILPVNEPPISVKIIQNEGAPVLNLSIKQIKLSKKEGDFIFFIRSNADWTISTETGWLKSDITNGKNSGRVTVNFQKNEDISQRKATIKVKVKGLPDQIIEIIQEGAK